MGGSRKIVQGDWERWWSFVHQVLKDGFEIVVIGINLFDGGAILKREFGQAAIESIGGVGLDGEATVAIEHLNSLDIFPGEKRSGEFSAAIADEHDVMGMGVDEIANLADVALSEQAAVI